jgi:hypothetical protein
MNAGKITFYFKGKQMSSEKGIVASQPRSSRIVVKCKSDGQAFEFKKTQNGWLLKNHGPNSLLFGTRFDDEEEKVVDTHA